MEIWIATGNQGKLKEFRKLLEPLGHTIKSIEDIPSFTPRPEDGATFHENARIKAKSLHAVKDKYWVLGEDAGLEAVGLNNLPGIHTARYAGKNASDVENYSKLLKMLALRNPNQREASFRSIIVAYSPEGHEYSSEGSLPGTISKKPAGSDGFGYDPIFIPKGEEKTLAELGLAFKNKNSHRAAAIQALLTEIGDNLK